MSWTRLANSPPSRYSSLCSASGSSAAGSGAGVWVSAGEAACAPAPFVPLTSLGCIFANGELFEGVLGERYAKRHVRELKAQFTAVGEALKAKVEG